jgi:hypothetical protein
MIGFFQFENFFYWRSKNSVAHTMTGNLRLGATNVQNGLAQLSLTKHNYFTLSRYQLSGSKPHHDSHLSQSNFHQPL